MPSHDEVNLGGWIQTATGKRIDPNYGSMACLDFPVRRNIKRAPRGWRRAQRK